MVQKLKDRYGSWALVAGAAEGLGGAFAKALAAARMNLILVDHQEDLLNALLTDLEARFHIQARALHLDLADQDAVQRMMENLEDVDCRFIIYNAAFSRVQSYLKNDRQMLDHYVQVNIQTPMQLTHAFCRRHQKRPDLKKGILLMSSMAGSWGTQLLAPYGASKAFNQNLAESLHYELKDEGFDVLACIAGPTATPGYLDSLPEGRRASFSAMSPDRVATAALRAMGKKAFVIPGFQNRLNYLLLSRVLPRRWSLKVMNRAVGKLYGNNL